MVKRIAVWIIAVMFFASTTPIFALDEGKSGPNPSKKAYEHANENARFKRTENLKDKGAVKAEKEAKKKSEKAKKEEEKAKQEAEKNAEKKQKEMEREVKKVKKGLGK